MVGYGGFVATWLFLHVVPVDVSLGRHTLKLISGSNTWKSGGLFRYESFWKHHCPTLLGDYDVFWRFIVGYGGFEATCLFFQFLSIRCVIGSTCPEINRGV